MLPFRVRLQDKMNVTVRIKGALKLLSFEDLALFESLARHESLAAAARELQLRAPFVTKALHRMERQLGHKLLNRSTRGVSLTSEGGHFLKLCQSISETIDQAEWLDPQPLGSPSRSLTVFGAPFLLTHLVAPYAYKIMKNENMGLRLIDLGMEEIQSGSYRDLFEAVVHHEKSEKLSLGQDWLSYPLGNASWILCARKGHPLGARATAKEVQQFPFVLPVIASRQGFRNVDDGCPLPVKKRLRYSEVRSGEVGLQIVESTDQLIFIPEIQARSRLRAERLQIVRVTDWAPVRKTVYLTVHQDQIKQRMLQGLVSALEMGLAKSSE